MKDYKCTHCDTVTQAPIYIENDDKSVFCCFGCRSVYQILHNKGLDHYYKLKSEASSLRASSPASVKADKFSYLDDEQFAEDFIKTDKFGNRNMEFYLEGVHCVACLWLMEKLPEITEEVISSKLNLSKSILSLSISSKSKFSKVASEIAGFGYKPHPIQKENDAEKLRLMEERRMLMKIGLAGGISGNIMILAVSLYAGATGELGKQFEWLSFFLSIPVLTYCASPFYKNFISFIKTKHFSVDVPVAIALVIGSFSGFFNLLKGEGEIYFDSLCILIFLLLGARYILQKAQNVGIGGNDLRHFFSLGTAHKFDPNTGAYSDILSKYLQIGDRIKILPGETIPVDGKITSGTTSLNASLLTGESLPLKVKTGDKVFSGTINISNEIFLEVLETENETRLGKILNQITALRGQRSSIVGLADIISKYFVYTVVSISILMILVGLYLNEFQTSVQRALTLIIITCPCALGLATPLALTRALSYLSKLGIIVRGEDVVERIGKVQKIFFDKTGTLTYGQFKVQSIKNHLLRKPDREELKIIRALESKSSHPLAVSICLYIDEKNIMSDFEVIDYLEKPGLGVSGYIEGQFYQVKSSSISGYNIGLFLDEQEIFSINLLDQIRESSKDGLKKLRDFKLKTYLLSGDRQDIALKVADELGFDKSEVFAQKGPEEKCEIVKKHSLSMMVGDGANDALAFNASLLGVAVHGSVEASLQAADVYSTSPGVSPLYQLILVGRETMKLIYRNLTLSLIYNVVGAILAILGIVTPLMAAILMPLSSLTVLFSTIFATKKLRGL